MKIKPSHLYLVAIVALVACFTFQWTARVHAQDAPAAGAPLATPTAAKPAGGMHADMTLWDWFVVGGWCMWPLLMCSVAGVGLIIRNEIVLKHKKLLRPDLLPGLAETIKRFDIAGAAPRFGNADHPVDRHRAIEVTRARCFVRRHPAHAEAGDGNSHHADFAQPVRRGDQVADHLRVVERRIDAFIHGQLFATRINLRRAHRPVVITRQSRTHLFEQRPQSFDVG